MSLPGICYIVDASEVSAEYKQFAEDFAHASLDFYELLDARMYAPADRYKRRHCGLDSLAASCTFAVHKYYPGGAQVSLVTVWKLPTEATHRDETAHAQCNLQSVKQAPLFHSRRLCSTAER